MTEASRDVLIHVGAPLTFPSILQCCPVPEVVLTDETLEREAVPGPVRRDGREV